MLSERHGTAGVGPGDPVLPRCLSLPEFADHEGSAGVVGNPLVGETGRPVEPLLVLDLGGQADAGLLERVIRIAAARERILVGVASRPLDPRRRALAEQLDVAYMCAPDHGGPLDRWFTASAQPLRDAAVLHAAAVARPRAALVLAQVLRAGERLPVPSGLDIESLAYSTLLGGAEFRAWLAGRRPRPVPPAEEPPVLVSRTGDTLGITLNRPERRNAYGRQLRDEFVDALRLALLDPGIRSVRINGAGPSFCAGGDLDEFGTTPDPATAHFVRTRGGAGGLLSLLAERTTVSVHGHCVGAGIELPAFAGRVTAHPDTVFRLPEVAMGLIPGAGGTVSIPRRIGRWRAFGFALSGAPLDAATAKSWGLVDEIEEPDRVRPAK